MPESDEEIPVESNDDDTPIIAEDAETMEVGVVEEQDPLEAALARAETAEKEIAYKDAEIQNIRKRFLAEKSDLIQYGSMGLARKMLAVLADVDRAMANIEEGDQSPLAQGLRLLRNKMWHELSGEGVTAIDAKGKKFDPAKMDAITTIPASEDFPAGMVVDVIEAGYMYKQRVLVASRVVVASDD
ncbi:MAG: nucleotide exchange factor GrpE [Euryarchaeota archaeon]|nr:nucleotide exchange factor GrpE [Euryarchaeota archaeon]DAC30436.1 MAG TPA: nucleotide exchange factor GrpE [Candidatus Poseidoniales archaeon]HII44970.1 nucleotide exchange factor GrpE [Candidatus Poseidoniaceae archaeon]|tara:strand:+ start:3079 stop:3636 length:558 start_codon:yes stop_codon:yes gene_type:complete